MSISAPVLPFDLACNSSLVDGTGPAPEAGTALIGDPSLSFASVLAGTGPAPAPAPAANLAAAPAAGESPGPEAEQLVDGRCPPSVFLRPDALPSEGNPPPSPAPVHPRHPFAAGRTHRSAETVLPSQAPELPRGLVVAASKRPEDKGVVTAVNEWDVEPLVDEESVSCTASWDIQADPAAVATPVAPAGCPVVTLPVATSASGPQAPQATDGERDSPVEASVVETPLLPPKAAEAAVVRPPGPETLPGERHARGQSGLPQAGRPETGNAAAQSGKPAEDKSPLPGALKKGERVPVESASTSEPQGKGVAVARTSRAPVRAEDVAGTDRSIGVREGTGRTAKSEEPANGIPLDRTLTPKRSESAGRAEGHAWGQLSQAPVSPVTPVSVESNGALEPAAPVSAETAPAVPADGMTPVPNIPTVTTPSLRGVRRPAGTDSTITSEATAAEGISPRPARFAAAVTRAASDRPAIAFAEQASARGTSPLQAPAVPEGESEPEKPSQPAWLRFPAGPQSATGAASPAWSPMHASRASFEATPAWTKGVSEPTPAPVATASEVDPAQGRGPEPVVEGSAETGLGQPVALPAAAISLLRRNAASPAAEKFAAAAAETPGSRAYGRVAAERETKNSALKHDKEVVVESKFTVGTEAAERKAPMRPDTHSIRTLPIREESISSSVTAGTPMRSESGALQHESPTETVVASSAANAVRQIVDVADKLWAADRPAVNVKIQLDDVGVAVRVEYRNGEVTASFQADSVELRDRLAAAWQMHVATAGEPRPYRIADPVFTTPTAGSFVGGGAAGQDFSSNGEQARQFAQSRQSDTPASSFTSGPASRSGSGSTSASEIRLPAPTSTSSRLHAFA